MARRPKPEEIVAKLRQVDVLLSQGGSVADAARSIGVTEVAYCRWRKEFGGLRVDHVARVTKLSERRVCRALGQHRSTRRQVPRGRDDDACFIFAPESYDEPAILRSGSPTVCLTSPDAGQQNRSDPRLCDPAKLDENAGADRPARHLADRWSGLDDGHDE